jgi:PBP1b-binding outer membrane lipoprotein LpoB
MKSFWLLTGSLVFIAGCATAPEPAVSYTDPGAQGHLVQGTGVESQDIAAAAAKAAQSILQLPQIAHASKPPIVLITPVTNRSSSPVDATIYTTKLRGTLTQYAAGKVRFLARDASWSANEEEQALRKAGEVESGVTGSSRKGATYDYILTAELQGISAGNSQGMSEYFIVSFKLVDFRDLLIWESQYEIKKEGRESAVYR